MDAKEMNYRWCFLFKVHKCLPQTPDKDRVRHAHENKNQHLRIQRSSLKKMAVKL